VEVFVVETVMVALSAVIGWLAALSFWLQARRERAWREKAVAGWQGANVAWRRIVDEVVARMSADQRRAQSTDVRRVAELIVMPANTQADAKYWQVH
jgi:hypothetical protein